MNEYLNEQRKKTIEQMKENPLNFIELKRFQRSDRDTVLAALHYCSEKDAEKIMHNSVGFQNDEGVILSYLRKCPENFSKTSEEIRKNKNMVIKSFSVCKTKKDLTTVRNNIIDYEWTDKEKEQVEKIYESIRNCRYII
jgi:hypothetical protein